MKPTVTPFTEVYTQWLDSFRAMLPGYAPAAPTEPALTTIKQEQAAANQEWEGEGGSIKPPAPGIKVVPKIPF